ncbi:MAG: efflux RND transporter periplasmic adaptor subunit [Treponema sp.]|nr:efflux RND transporter periplasmic adaptor subunit [Treponema sp.]
MEHSAQETKLKGKITMNNEQSAISNCQHTTIHKKLNFILVLIIASFILIACNRGESAAQAEFNVPVFAVNTTFAVQGPLQDYITFSGDIVAESSVDVFSDAAGRITDIFVSVGDRVGAGTPIASVDPSRPGMTFMPGIATSPIAGTIVALPAQVGMMITQAVPLARIAGGGALEVRLHVAERFISQMSLGLSCEITLDAWPGEVFFGNISEVSPVVDLASRTMEVRVSARNTGGRLRPGMFARVRVITESKDNAIKVPAAAVVNRFGEQYVFVVEQDEEDPEINIVRRRIVVPGISIGGITEIQSGLAPNEEVVLRGQTMLNDGSRVNIVNLAAPVEVTPPDSN